jgi:outer membrane protein TolC
MEAARRRVEAARWGVRAAWRGTLPDAGVQIGAMQTAGRGAALVGIAIELPLRDRGAAARERARGEQALAEAELEVARGRVAAEVAAAIEVCVRLVEAAPAESFALAERGAEVARIAGTAYREGAVSLMELLDAQRAHADARTTAATWAAELAMARIELCRALGAPIEEAL